MKRIFLLSACIISSACSAANISFNSNQTKEVSELFITVNLSPQELLYEDSIQLTVDNPNIEIVDWNINVPAKMVYDPTSKRTQAAYENDVIINAVVKKTTSEQVQDATVRFEYLTNAFPSPFDMNLPVEFAEVPSKKEIKSKSQSTTTSNLNGDIHKVHKPFSFSKYISRWIKHTNSLPLRILLIFILGMLLSLTPCIYPMIPITVGILKSQSTTSIVRNFLVALSYTLGISLTYALFGMLASMLGPIWGCLLTNPIFVLSLVALLIYCALSMFDLYDLYIPRFLQHGGSTKYNSSLFSAFIFGAASGTIASPCISPGLAVVLSIVATIGNMFIGFILLFAFGVGLSLPLLIIGTFSTSASMLPRAGVWMNEVKKILGLVLLGLCFYYLKNIMPWGSLVLLGALFCFVFGIYWLYHALHTKNAVWKKINNLIGILLLGGSVLLAVESLQIFFSDNTVTRKEPLTETWQTNYQEARKRAITENKLLFLDFWASWCSICISINNTVLKDSNVLQALHKNYILVSVDATVTSQQPYATLGQKYKITGFPTFLVVDPVTEKIVKEFNSNIYSMPRDQFIHKLNKYTY